MVDNSLIFLLRMSCMMLLYSKVTCLPGSCSMEGLRVNCKSAGLKAVPDLPPNATEVDLSYNSITQISHEQFSNLPNLRQLSLSFNQITSIEDNAFSSLGKLVSLELSNNSLNAISSATFQGLDDTLQMLSLMSNPQLTVENGTFQTLTSISTLLLQDFVGADVYNFSQMTNLEFLTAPDCQIQSLNPLNFLGLESLTSLDLAGNVFHQFPSAVIKQLPALESLNMAQNGISGTKGPLVSPNSTISTLNLDSNKLDSLHADTFQGMKNLGLLTLTDNNLFTLPEGLFDQLIASSVDVELAGNPVVCDCRLRWMTAWLEAANHHIDEVACAFPMYLYQEQVEGLTPDKFVCLPESPSGSVQYNVTVGGNVTISNPFSHLVYTNYTWYSTCSPEQVEIEAGDTYSFGTNSSLVITNVQSSLCPYYDMVAANIAGRVDATVILQLSGVSHGPSVLVISLSVAVGVVGLIAIAALVCHFSRVRKFSRAMNMLRYNNLSDDA